MTNDNPDVEIVAQANNTVLVAEDHVVPNENGSTRTTQIIHTQDDALYLDIRGTTVRIANEKV